MTILWFIAWLSEDFRWSANVLPFSCKPAAESAPPFYTMSLRRDCQLQRLVRQRSRALQATPADAIETIPAPTPITAHDVMALVGAATSPAPAPPEREPPRFHAATTATSTARERMPRFEAPLADARELLAPPRSPWRRRTVPLAAT